MSQLSLDAYWQLSPIARNFATATFVLSAGIHFHLISGYPFFYDSQFILRFPPHIWRFVTCYMITGPNLGILFDTYLIYNYMSQLEKGHPRLAKREDVVWYLIFICSTIMALSHLSGFPMPVLTQALILAMSYTVTQEQKGAQTNFMFFNIPSQTVPFAMMAINLFFPGGVGIIIQQLHGLVAAHLYLFLSKIWPELGGGRNPIPTPAFLSRVVQSPRVSSSTHGTGIRPLDRASGRSSGVSSGPLPDSWRTRGPGQRLG